MVFVTLIGLFIAFAYLLNQYLFSFWSNRGFKQMNPTFLIGDAGPMFQMKKSVGDFCEDIYNKHKSDKLVGIYMTYRRALVVNDPKLVSNILIRDFNSFTDRPMPCNTDIDPLSGHLFNLPGQQWRDLRVKLSPTFTSGKLKGMFSVIKDTTKVLEDYLVNNVNSGVNVFEFRDLMARYNTNIISSVAFGIENDCINDPDHIFRKMGIKFLEPTTRNKLVGLIVFLGFSPLAYKLKMKLTQQEFDDFIFDIVNQTINHRELNNITRNDFMQLLIQLKNQGYVSADKGESEADKEQNIKKLTIAQIAAQVFVFFIAGFETTSSTLSFCLYEMAKDKKLQEKTQAEIDKVLRTAGPDGVTYDLLSDMKYVECCIDETLRKYPVVNILMRTAVKDYKVENTNLVIPKETQIFIPVLGLHRDPDIFENPLEFKPERFLHSHHGGGKAEGSFYIPFGDGPRNCIGMRMGKLTAKIALTLILSKFNLELTDKELMDNELEFDPAAFVLAPKKAFNIKITPR